MSASALALVVLAGLIHAIWNIAAKKAGGDVRFAAFSALLLMVIWAPLGLWLGWRALPLWGATQWALVAALSPMGYVLVLFAMQTAPLSHVAPAREVSMLFAALIGGQLLGEGDRALRIFGAACIAFGVMALALG